MQRSSVRFDDLYGHSISPLSRINTIKEGCLVVPDTRVHSCGSTMGLLRQHCIYWAIFQQHDFI